MCTSDLVLVFGNQGLPVLGKMLSLLSPVALWSLWNTSQCLQASLAGHPLFRLKGMVAANFSRLGRKDWTFSRLVYPLCLWLSQRCTFSELEALVCCLQRFGQSGSGRALRWNFTWEYPLVEGWISGRGLPELLPRLVELDLASLLRGGDFPHDDLDALVAGLRCLDAQDFNLLGNSLIPAHECHLFPVRPVGSFKSLSSDKCDEALSLAIGQPGYVPVIPLLVLHHVVTAHGRRQPIELMRLLLFLETSNLVPLLYRYLF